MKIGLILSLLLAGLIAQTGCSPQQSNTQTESAPASTRFSIALGSKEVQLEIALSDAERQKGLMFRESLDPDHGMLFVFDRAVKQGFWMRNTPLPLDIGFFDSAGTLKEIHKLYPYDETAVASRSSEILIALEMEQGWFTANDVRPGERLDMDALRSAITARGFSVDRFPLE